MKRYKLLSLFLVSVSMLTLSCQKEGPAGPAGPAGATGASGPTGPAGPAGTANVIYSAWFSFTAANWADSTIPNLGSTKRALRLAPGITQSILDQGVVLAYQHSGTQYHQLTWVAPSPLPVWITGKIDNVSKIIFYIVQPDGSNPGGVWGTANEWRYVIIPGAVSGGRMMNGAAAGYTVEQLKAMPYDEVLRIFNIPPEGSNE